MTTGFSITIKQAKIPKKSLTKHYKLCFFFP